MTNNAIGNIDCPNRKNGCEEYSSDKPVFWVPHPLPLNRLIPILNNLGKKRFMIMILKII